MSSPLPLPAPSADSSPPPRPPSPAPPLPPSPAPPLPPEAAADLEAVDAALSTYLTQYAQLSLQLFGRWPAYVPAEERDIHKLRNGSARLSAGPPLPDELKPPPLPAGWGTGRELGDLASSPRRGSKAMAALGGGLATPRRARLPLQLGRRASNASALSSVEGEQQRELADGVIAEAEAREAVLREQMDRINEKMRVEVERRNAAAEEALQKSFALNASQAAAAKLEERVRTLSEQLDQEKARTLSLERRLREAQTARSAADSKAASERKQRFRLEVRLERLDKSVEPLRKDNERRGLVMSQADAARRSAEKAQAAAEERASTLALENKSLQQRLNEAHARFEETQRKVASSLATLERADLDREEALEARDESTRRLREMRATLDEVEASMARARADEAAAQRSAAASAEEAAASAEALAAAHAEVESLRAALAAARTSEALANEKMEQMMEEAEHAREQQSGLFGVLSELLARVLYLRELPPEVLGMGRAEMARYEAEAVRHLKSIRDAAARDALATDVVCAPPTVAVGAAILKAAVAATDEAAAIGDWEAPEGVFLSRVDNVDRLPRPRASAPAPPARASPRSAPAQQSPRGADRHALAADGGRGGARGKGGGTPRGALASVSGQVRPSVDAADSPADPASATPRTDRTPRSGAGGKGVPPHNRPVISGGTTLPAAPPKAGVKSARGPRTKRVARADEMAAGALFESTEWEKRKLLELMHRTDLEGAGNHGLIADLIGGGIAAGAGSAAAIVVRSGESR